jgi:glutamine amidotransferase
MCRLFAQRARSTRPPRLELLEGDNALSRQSREHAHGWGVAHWDQGRLLLDKGVEPAHQSLVYRSLAARVSSQAVIAHIRKASVGGITVANTHPFAWGSWAFAHNGTVQRFAEREAHFRAASARDLQGELGETDSERCFRLFLSRLRAHRQADRLGRVCSALAEVAALVRAGDPPGLEKPSSANFIVSDGDVLAAVRLGKELVYAFEPGPEPLLLVASEPTSPDHEWCSVPDGHGVAVDGRFGLRLFEVPRRLQLLRPTG